MYKVLLQLGKQVNCHNFNLNSSPGPAEHILVACITNIVMNCLLLNKYCVYC